MRGDVEAPKSPSAPLSHRGQSAATGSYLRPVARTRFGINRRLPFLTRNGPHTANMINAASRVPQENHATTATSTPPPKPQVPPNYANRRAKASPFSVPWQARHPSPWPRCCFFAHLADSALNWTPNWFNNTRGSRGSRSLWALPLIARLTRKFAPFHRRQRHPAGHHLTVAAPRRTQKIAADPHRADRCWRFRWPFWVCCSACPSGREVRPGEVGAAVMSVGRVVLETRLGIQRDAGKRFAMAAGAASVFSSQCSTNSPLAAGVIAAIQELRAASCCAERQILLWRARLKFTHRSPYSGQTTRIFPAPTAAYWNIPNWTKHTSGLVCGAAGGLFGSFALIAVRRRFAPRKIRGFHPQTAAAAGGTDGAAARPARHVLPRQNLRHSATTKRRPPCTASTKPFDSPSPNGSPPYSAIGRSGGIFTLADHRRGFGRAYRRHRRHIAGANIIVLICMAALAGATQSSYNRSSYIIVMGNDGRTKACCFGC